jgi:hypothetical protein
MNFYKTINPFSLPFAFNKSKEEKKNLNIPPPSSLATQQ